MATSTPTPTPVATAASPALGRGLAATLTHALVQDLQSLPPVPVGDALTTIMQQLHGMAHLENETKGQVFQRVVRAAAEHVQQLQAYLPDLPVMLPILQAAFKFTAASGGLESALTAGVGMAAGAVTRAASALTAAAGPAATLAHMHAVQHALEALPLQGLPLPEDYGTLLRMLYKAVFRASFASRHTTSAQDDVAAVLDELRQSPQLEARTAQRQQLLDNVALYGPIVLGIVKGTIGSALTAAMAAGQASLTQLVNNGAELVVDSISKCCAWGKAKAQRTAASLQLMAPVVSASATPGGGGGGGNSAGFTTLHLPVRTTVKRDKRAKRDKRDKRDKRAKRDNQKAVKGAVAHPV